MNFDRNTVIGFIVLALLFFGFFYYNNQQQIAAQKEKAKQDSIAKASQPIPNPAIVKKDSIPLPDTLKEKSDSTFQQSANATEQLSFTENELMKIAFTNKGGQPKWIELKKFKAPDSTNVKLSATDFDKISYTVMSGGKTSDISNLYFTGGQVVKNADKSETITYQLQTTDGNSLVHQFIIKPEYMVDFNLQINGINQLLPNHTLFLTWKNKARQLQKDVDYEKLQSQVCFNMDGEYDYYKIESRTEKELDKPVKWVAVKQQFFSSALIAKTGSFSSGKIEWSTSNNDSDKTVVQAITNLRYQLPNSSSATIPMAIYYGPTDYKTLKRYGNDMENMVDLGTGIFAFVKYINRWIIIPIFDLFSKFTNNFGIVILLLTLFIRLLISPLTYSSYLSGAKMKVLRPEIEQLKVKYGGDQQQISVEQMKLFREAGVNPLGGCIPALLQIPIFFALYSFFNSNVALRGQSFLWANDLSQYDSILELPFNIPLYGEHVSLFTLTATLTSFLISIYSMNMTPDQNNPVLKYMPYFFPIILLFVFNKLPAGLTWYYTVSNIITLVLQFVIQNYIIDHDKILAKIEINRKKPKTKSKLQLRMEQMQQQQKQLRESQNKNRR